ncbi:MAG: DUF4271 domain-containing protein [Flammeovirgaceae bacterium]
MRQWLFILFLLGCCWANLPQGYAQEDVVVKNLNSDWVVFDEESGVYVPYFKNYHGNVTRVHLLLEQKRWASFTLQIQSNPKVRVFVNNKLIDFVEGNEAFYQISTLAQPAQDTLLVTLYHPENRLFPLHTNIVRYQTITDTSLKGDRFIQPHLRNRNLDRNLFTFLSIILLGVFAFFSRIPNPIFDFDYLRRYLVGFTKSINQGTRINGLSFLVFNVVFCFSLAFILMVLNRFTSFSKDTNIPFLPFTDTALGKFLSYCSFILMFLAGKYLVIWLLSILYDFRKILNIHIQEFMNVNQIYCILLIFGGVLLNFSSFPNPFTAYSWGITFVVSTILFSSFLTIYRINKVLPFRKVYLFSYLCATEFLPALVLVRLLLGN